MRPRTADTDGAPLLKKFLEHPDRPAGTLKYHELEGFLFAVTSAPELIPPSEWIPQVFGESEPAYETVDELNAVLAELMDLYNSVNASVSADEVLLPPDCAFHNDAVAHLDEDSPVSLWSRGFALGHQWLEESWDAYLPEEQ